MSRGVPCSTGFRLPVPFGLALPPFGLVAFSIAAGTGHSPYRLLVRPAMPLTFPLTRQAGSAIFPVS